MVDASSIPRRRERRDFRCSTQLPPCWITGALREARAVEEDQGGYGCIGGVKLNACAQGASRRGASVPPVGGCETERAEFADQSRRISRLRYTSPRHRPRLSMGIGERRAVPTLADAHQAPGRTADRERDAAYGIRSVTNDIGPYCDPSCNAAHVRLRFLKSNNKFAEGLRTTTTTTTTTTTATRTTRTTTTTATGRNDPELTRRSISS